MSETPEAPAARRGIDWNMLTAIMAVLVGALALAVSVYTARLQQLQVRAEVLPHLSPVYNSAEQRLLIANKGVGPARLMWVSMAVGEQTVTTWAALMQALDLSTEALGGYSYSSLEPQMIGAGETVSALQINDATGWSRFLQARARGPLRMTVCYCSVLDECRVAGAEADPTLGDRWLDACPAPIICGSSEL
jgi:hypothetical protein